MITIVPSIASADPLRLKESLTRVADLGRLHLDIEDGNFVDNITFGKKTVQAIAAEFRGEMDVHLMTTTPLDYVGWLAEAGMRAVCAHIEALAYPKRFLTAVRSLGMRAGLALNLKVGVDELLSYADCVDYVLVMTSEPDGADQRLFPCAVERVSRVRKSLPPRVRLWCDGGIGAGNLGALHAAGMDVAIMGRALFGVEDPVSLVREYEKVAERK